MFKAGLVFEGRRNGQKWHSQAIPPKRSKEMDPWFHSYYWPHSTGCFWSNFAVGNSSTWPWEMCRLHLPGIEWGQSQELCLGVDRAPRIAAKPITVRCILVSDTMQQKYIYIIYIWIYKYCIIQCIIYYNNIYIFGIFSYRLDILQTTQPRPGSKAGKVPTMPRVTDRWRYYVHQLHREWRSKRNGIEKADISTVRWVYFNQLTITYPLVN